MLIREGDDDLHHTLKQNLVRGYSGIFTRKHVVSETRLRHADGDICQNIVGYDVNSLYLNCIGQTMPCEGYVRRLALHFALSSHFKCESMFEWMDYISSTGNVRILHAKNHREIRLVVIWWMVIILKPILSMSIMAVSGMVVLCVK